MDANPAEMIMELKPADIMQLYGDKFFIVPGDGGKSAQTAAAPSTLVKEAIPEVVPTDSPAQVEPAKSAPSIKWGLKPDSRVIFIFTMVEKANPDLTELLKKIVDSLGIPTDHAGFGFITGEDIEGDLEIIPGKFGIVFGKHFNKRSASENPAPFNGIPVFFAHSLEALSENREFKLELWNYLKSIQPNI